MLLSLSFLRKAVIVGCLASVLSPSLRAESSYRTNGGEYAIAGVLPAEQVMPRAAIRPTGGYIVWQDRATDGDGYGIRALRLDASFSKTLAPFRVNETSAYDQEKPFVANLKDGGAVFVWQSGRLGFQRIFARFLTPAGTWQGGEIQVSSTPAEFQINPSAAVLEDGNVAVIWAGYNQNGSGTMQDVFGQILSPTGGKVGAEFRVNMFQPYNQRTPAVAPLKGGGFVVTWVSEQQRTAVPDGQPTELLSANTRPSVDVYARTFLASGVAASVELLVNTNTITCANPTVSEGSDGGFLVAWSELDPKVYRNSWDIFYRKFQSVNTVGIVQRLNSTTLSQQLAPRLSRSGDDFMAVWTSMGQDGSMEGIYGRFISGSGTPASDELRVNSTTVSKQIEPVVAADGDSQFLVVWTGFVGGSSSFDLFAQRYAEAGEALQPMNAPFVYAPFHLEGGVYQPRIHVTWPAQSGLPVARYELFVDDEANARVLTTNTSWQMTAQEGLKTSTTHSFRVSCVLTDGRRTPLSPAASVTTWGGFNWDGIPFEWMTENFGGNVAAWPPASRVLGVNGPTVLQVFQTGAKPNDPATWLRTKLEHTRQGMFLSWNPQPGFVYQVQKSTNLAQWQNVGGPRMATGSLDSLQVSQGASGYYRVVLMR